MVDWFYCCCSWIVTNKFELFISAFTSKYFLTSVLIYYYFFIFSLGWYGLGGIDCEMKGWFRISCILSLVQWSNSATLSPFVAVSVLAQKKKTSFFYFRLKRFTQNASYIGVYHEIAKTYWHGFETPVTGVSKMLRNVALSKLRSRPIKPRLLSLIENTIRNSRRKTAIQNSNLILLPSSSTWRIFKYLQTV